VVKGLPRGSGYSASLWRHPAFLRLWTASAISDIGSQDYYVNAVSVRQALTPDRLRGRVNATMRFIAGGMQPIGALIGGALGTILGLPATLGVAAFGMLLAVLWLYLSPVRTLRALPAIES
jgi:hypothetical protein